VSPARLIFQSLSVLIAIIIITHVGAFKVKNQVDWGDDLFEGSALSLLTWVAEEIDCG
jgi:hypothetical protein